MGKKRKVTGDLIEFDKKIGEIFSALNIPNDSDSDSTINEMKNSLSPSLKNEIMGNKVINSLIEKDKKLTESIKKEHFTGNTYETIWEPLLKNLGKLQTYILLKNVPVEIIEEELDAQEDDIEKKKKEIEEKDKVIEEQKQEIDKIKDYINEKDKQLEERDKQIGEKDKQIEDHAAKIAEVNTNKELINKIISALTEKIGVVNSLLSQNIKHNDTHNKYIKYKSKYLHVKKYN